MDISSDDVRYSEPLERDASSLAATLAADEVVVLLGSIATGKYVDVVDSRLGGRLRFPVAFVGRGDMSRGGLSAAARGQRRGARIQRARSRRSPAWPEAAEARPGDAREAAGRAT